LTQFIEIDNYKEESKDGHLRHLPSIGNVEPRSRENLQKHELLSFDE